MGDNLLRREARTETQCDDAARRRASNEVEGIGDPNAQILLQTCKHMRSEQRLGAPSIESEDLEALGARASRLALGCWIDLRGEFARSRRGRTIIKVGRRRGNYIHVTRLRRSADNDLAVIATGVGTRAASSHVNAPAQHLPAPSRPKPFRSA